MPLASRSLWEMIQAMVTTARLKAKNVFERGIMPLAISIATKSLQIAHGSHPLKALFSMSARNPASDPSGWSLSARTVGSYNPGCPAPR